MAQSQSESLDSAQEIAKLQQMVHTLHENQKKQHQEWQKQMDVLHKQSFETEQKLAMIMDIMQELHEQHNINKICNAWRVRQETIQEAAEAEQNWQDQMDHMPSHSD